MDNQKQQVADRIKEANNVLVTVSNNPSVDQLAACIGLTLALNKMGKHATAVFSGSVPSTIEFLQPEKTIEKNTDSLRDFIIALDKSKADKLRYKVEDRVVKIFITPYRTSIGEKDLEYSQGDFNVDVVVALGVHNQADLDQAITSHGRILHDATVITVNTKPGGELGGINWLNAGASSLAELAAQLVEVLDKKLIDGQIATSFLTGIVAETERFSNAKTSPQTMSVSADLMAAGANQQLVATKLEAPAPPPLAPIADAQPYVPPAATANEDGTLEIAHEQSAVEPLPEPEPEPEQGIDQESPVSTEVSEPEEVPEQPPAPQIHIDEHGELQQPTAEQSPFPPREEPEIKHTERPYLGDPSPHADIPGMMGSPMSANVSADGFLASPDPLSLPNLDMPLLERAPLQPPAVPNHDVPSQATATPVNNEAATNGPPLFAPAPQAAPVEAPAPPVIPATETAPYMDQAPHFPQATPVDTTPIIASETLSKIEEDVASLHLQADPAYQVQTPTIITPENPVVADQPTDVDDARNAVERAINSASDSPVLQTPIEALNAQPLGSSLSESPAPTTFNPVAFGASDAATYGPVQGQGNGAVLPQLSYEQQPAYADPNAPPPVPPPMLPPTYSGQ